MLFSLILNGGWSINLDNTCFFLLLEPMGGGSHLSSRRHNYLKIQYKSRQRFKKYVTIYVQTFGENYIVYVLPNHYYKSIGILIIKIGSLV